MERVSFHMPMRRCSPFQTRARPGSVLLSFQPRAASWDRLYPRAYSPSDTMAVTHQHTKPVLIIGAGVSGLLLAQCLRVSGISFRVFERDHDLTTRGVGWGSPSTGLYQPCAPCCPRTWSAGFRRLMLTELRSRG